MGIDIASGILTSLAASLLYGIAFFICYKGEKIVRGVWFMIIAGAILRIFCSSDPMLHAWDERYHALVAKNAMEDPMTPRLYKEPVLDYELKNWTANAIWLHKQPFPLWMMAISLKLFGINEFALRIPSVLFSTWSIFLIFFIAKNLYSERIGLIAAFFQSINGLVIELSAGRVATDHIDTFFLFLIELSLFFIVLNIVKKNRWALVFSGVSCGLAIMTKWLPALIVFPLYLALNFNRKEAKSVCIDLGIMAFTTAAIALPWQWYAYIHYPSEYLWEQHYNTLHFAESLEGHGEAWWYFLDKIRITVNEMVYIALLWFIYFYGASKTWLRQNTFIAIWIILPLIVFSIAQTKMQGYIVFTFPAYFIVLALFIEKSTNMLWSRNKTTKRLHQVVLMVTLLLAFRYGMERVKPLDSRMDAREAKRELKNIQLPQKSVLFNMPAPIEAMFYSDCTAYPIIPDTSMINALLKKQYRLYMVDDGILPTCIIENKGITTLCLPAALKWLRPR